MRKRQFSRIPLRERCVLEYGVRVFPGRLMNVSLTGALVQLTDECRIRPGDRWCLSFNLGNPDYMMRFGVEVVHCRDRQVGLLFVESDLNALFYLRNLLEERLGDLGQAQSELELLFAAEPPEWVLEPGDGHLQRAG
jgi:hypothetical protein